MRFSIGSVRETADDYDRISAQSFHQIAHDLLAVGSDSAAAYDGKPSLIEARKIAAQVQTLRRIRYFPQLRGKVRWRNEFELIFHGVIIVSSWQSTPNVMLAAPN